MPTSTQTRPAEPGTRHFIQQRFTALLNLPLGLFAFWLLWQASVNVAQAVSLLGQPLMAGLLLAFIINALVHMKLGLDGVLDDYIPSLGWRFFCKSLNRLVVFIAGLTASIALSVLVLQQV